MSDRQKNDSSNKHLKKFVTSVKSLVSEMKKEEKDLLTTARLKHQMYDQLKIDDPVPACLDPATVKPLISKARVPRPAAAPADLYHCPFWFFSLSDNAATAFWAIRNAIDWKQGPLKKSPLNDEDHTAYDQSAGMHTASVYFEPWGESLRDLYQVCEIYEVPENREAILQMQSGMMQPEVVSDSDPRVELRGQLKLTARVPLRENQLLGFYCGTYFLEEEFSHIRESLWNSEAVQAYSQDTDFEIPDEVMGLLPDNYKISKLLLDSLGHRGRECPISFVRLANDPTVDPFRETLGLSKAESRKRQEKVEEKVKEKGQPKSNVEAYNFMWKGWPYMFLVTSRKVKAGEELLYDYGPGYWYIMGDTYRAAAEYHNTPGQKALQKLMKLVSELDTN